jgi:hypothetical protein
MRSASPLRTLLRCGCPPRRTADTHLRHVNDRRVYGGAGQFYAPSTVTGLFAGSSQRALAPSLRRRSLYQRTNIDRAGRIVIPTPAISEWSGSAFPAYSTASKNSGSVTGGVLLTGKQGQQRPEHDQPASTVSGTSNPCRILHHTDEGRAGEAAQVAHGRISAIPAAPAEPLRKAVGSAQKTGITERRPTGRA